jgi:hypothetical protein
MDSKGIRIIPYQDSFHEEVSQFYAGHGWKDPPAKSILPDLGFVAVDENGGKLAVGFLYESNSNVFFLEWTATNPKARLRTRAVAFKLLVKTIMILAKKQKPGAVIMQYTPNEAIIRAYKKLGFIETERATLLVWK